MRRESAPPPLRHRRAATALLLPYWAWVTFAGALNLAIWQLNT